VKFFDEIKTFFELHIVSKSLVAYKLIFWYSTMELDEHILRLQGSLKVVFKITKNELGIIMKIKSLFNDWFFSWLASHDNESKQFFS